ncbi:acetyltransferase [Clostridium sp. DL1XJH146]
MDKIVLIGAGGHCKVIIDIIENSYNYEIVGVLDKTKKGYINDTPIIGNDDELLQLFNNGVKNAFVCLGALDNLIIRQKIYNKLKKIGFEIPTLIHKNSIVSKFATIGDGTAVMPCSVINSGAIIKENCIINTSAVIEHDCVIGANCMISPRAALAGGVTVGDNSLIGIGSSIIQGVNIGSNTIIGAGAVVIRDIENNVVAVGVPAKILNKRG